MPVETIISLIVAVAALGFTALSFRRTVNKDNAGNASQLATMTADIRYIRQTIDDIKSANREITADVANLRTKIAEVAASVENAHKRIDDITKGKPLPKSFFALPSFVIFRRRRYCVPCLYVTIWQRAMIRTTYIMQFIHFREPLRANASGILPSCKLMFTSKIIA